MAKWKLCFVLGWLFGEATLLLYTTTDVVLGTNCAVFFTLAFFIGLGEL